VELIVNRRRWWVQLHGVGLFVPDHSIYFSLGWKPYSLRYRRHQFSKSDWP